MAEPYKHIYKVDLNQRLIRRDVGILATFDSKANRFGAELYRDGTSVSASGYTVIGYFIRPDEETVNCPGTVEGNLVYVDLLPGCYFYDGAFEFTLKIKQGEEEKAVLMCYGNVVRSRTDATASGGKVIVTVPNAEMLGGKAPEYYLQPRNLLDNGYFVNPVNQRGVSNGTAYIIDRWYVDGDGSSGIALTSNGIAFTSASAINQKVAGIPAGKELTFAFCTSSGTVYALQGIAKYNSDESVVRISIATVEGMTVSMDSYGGALRCRIAFTNAITVKWAALYEGSYTAETLPPYVPKGYAVELAECQRYFRKYTHVSIAGDPTAERYLPMSITYSKMRTVPSVSFSQVQTSASVATSAVFERAQVTTDSLAMIVLSSGVSSAKYIIGLELNADL